MFRSQAASCTRPIHCTLHCVVLPAATRRPGGGPQHAALGGSADAPPPPLPTFRSAQNLRRASFCDNELTQIEGLERCTTLEELLLEENRIASLGGPVTGPCMAVYPYPCPHPRTRTAGPKPAPSPSRSRRSAEGAGAPHSLTPARGRRLENLIYLRRLDLGKNRLTKIEGLDCLTRLTQLSLEDNQIASLAGLGNMNNLMELCARPDHPPPRPPPRRPPDDADNPQVLGGLQRCEEERHLGPAPIKGVDYNLFKGQHTYEGGGVLTKHGLQGPLSPFRLPCNDTSSLM